MKSVSPVFTEQEVFAEQVIALDQPQYLPIIVARIKTDEFQASVTRYRLSEEERQQVASGADILVYQPHVGPLMPLAFALANPGQYPAIEGECSSLA